MVAQASGLVWGFEPLVLVIRGGEWEPPLTNTKATKKDPETPVRGKLMARAGKAKHALAIQQINDREAESPPILNLAAPSHPLSFLAFQCFVASISPTKSESNS